MLIPCRPPSPPGLRARVYSRATLAGHGHPRPLGTTRDRELGARAGRGDPLRGARAPGEVVEEHIALIEAVNPRAQRDRRDALRRGPRRGRRRRRARRRGRRPGEELPPLLGVPCTIKESFAVAGMPQHLRLARPRRRRRRALGDRRRSAWSTPARSRSGSRTPPSSRSGSSPRTRSGGGPTTPTTRRRTAGGSSGGEGAAVGSGFAPIGLGTDIGGSIRLPGLLQRRLRPQADRRPRPPHRPLPVPKRAWLGDARLGPAGPPRRGPDAVPAHRRRPRRHRPRPCARSELGDPGEVSIEGLRVVISDDATLIPVALELRNAQDPRRAGAARGRRRGRPRLAARGEERCSSPT